MSGRIWPSKGIQITDILLSSVRPQSEATNNPPPSPPAELGQRVEPLWICECDVWSQLTAVMTS